jgi:hypothetical protein
MESHDDSEIIYMTKIIEDQRAHLVNFELELPRNLPLIEVRLQPKDQ